MTLYEIKGRVIFQTNNDAEDLGDFMPAIDGYVNEGYDLLTEAWAKEHGGSEAYPWLLMDEDEPGVPQWTHPAMADYATWLVYRNGNPQKQQRGMQYLQAFLRVLARVRESGGQDGAREYFVNVFVGGGERRVRYPDRQSFPLGGQLVTSGGNALFTNDGKAVIVGG